MPGADKVAINTAAIKNPDFVREAAEKFGSQCIVVAIDAKRAEGGRFEIFTHGGREATGIEAVGWARRMTDYGAGEKSCSPRWTAMGPRRALICR